MSARTNHYNASVNTSGNVTPAEEGVYVHLLRQCWEDKSQQLIPNRYPWHSRVATRELFGFALSRQSLSRSSGDGAQHIVRILTGTLPDCVYGKDGTYNAIRSFIEAGGEVRILAWAEGISRLGGERLLLLQDQTDRLSIRVSGTDESGDTLNHFVVVDNCAFRLETPHKRFDQASVTDFSPESPAMICFDNCEIGERLVSMFDELWRHAASTANLAAI